MWFILCTATPSPCASSPPFVPPSPCASPRLNRERGKLGRIEGVVGQVCPELPFPWRCQIFALCGSQTPSSFPSSLPTSAHLLLLPLGLLPVGRECRRVEVVAQHPHVSVAGGRNGGLEGRKREGGKERPEERGVSGASR